MVCERSRLLLVLRREYEAADLGPDAVKGCFALPCRMQDVSDVPRDRLVGSNGKDAVLDGDRRQLKMLPFARLAQSPSLFVASLEFANHSSASCWTIAHEVPLGLGNLVRVDLSSTKASLGSFAIKLSRYFIMPLSWNARREGSLHKGLQFRHLFLFPASLIVIGDFNSAISTF